MQEVVPAGRQLERAIRIARTVAAQAPLGVQGTLASARQAQRSDEHRPADHLRGLLPQLVASQDPAEGVLSFLQRRDARFTDR